MNRSQGQCMPQSIVELGCSCCTWVVCIAVGLNNYYFQEKLVQQEKFQFTIFQLKYTSPIEYVTKVLLCPLSRV
jgi:hypothetical protein